MALFQFYTANEHLRWSEDCRFVDDEIVDLKSEEDAIELRTSLRLITGDDEIDYCEFHPIKADDLIMNVAEKAIEEIETAISRTQGWIDYYKECVAIVQKVKELLYDVPKDKKPCDSVDELIKVIQGTDLPVYVLKYIDDHHVEIYTPDGKVEKESRENFYANSALYISGYDFRYRDAWDFDDDIAKYQERLEREERDLIRFQERLMSINELKGENV